jgi:FixJ family two-component response regulator
MKPFSDEALLSAIRVALERSKISLDREAETRSLRDRYASLSRREREVMARVVCGRLNKQVAFELGISEITVKIHRGTLMKKMGAHSLAALATMAASLSVPSSVKG